MKMQTKKRIVKIICFCMAVIMMITCMLPLTSYAAEESPFIITGEYNGKFNLTTDEENLFNISKAAPGNVYKGKITVKNDGPDRMDIAIIDIVSNISDESLYEKLELKISKDGVSLYSGSYGNTPDPVTDFYVVKGRSSIDFDIEVSFPKYSNNDFQGKELNTTWTFEAKYHNKERVQTGHELISSNPMDTYFPMIVFSSVAVIIVSVLLIIYLKKKEDKEQE